MPLKISDLERMFEVDFAAGVFGLARSKAFSGDFDIWMRQGLEDRLWPDGASFVCDLLRQSRRSTDGHEFDEAAISGLDHSQLNEIADAFLAATGSYFHPAHIATGDGRRRRVRRRTESEVYEVAKSEGEGGADRLLRVLRDHAQDRRDSMTMMLQPSQSIIDLMDSVNGSSLGAVHGQAGAANTYTSLLHQERSAHDRMMEAVTGARSAKRVTDAVLGVGHNLAMEAAIGRGPNRSFGQLLTRPDLDGLGLAGAALKADRGSVLSAFQSLAQYPDLGPTLAFGLRAETSAAQAVAAAFTGRTIGHLNPYEPLAASERLMKDYSGFLSSQSRFASTVDRYFGLNLSDPFRSMLLTAERAQDFAAGRSVFPPGFQLTAVAGLADIAVGGAAADVLRRYGDQPGTAPIFAAAMSSATAFDDGVVAPSISAERLEALAALIVEALPLESDPVRRMGFVEILTLVLAIISAAAGVGSFIADVGSSTSAELAAVPAEILNLRADLDAQERKRAQDDRSLRYVSRRSPLRLEPAAVATIVRRVYPDQILRVIGEQGSWLLVEVMDYQGDGVTRGWLNRSSARVRPAR